MYTWILVGGAVLAIGIALKNLLSRRSGPSFRISSSRDLVQPDLRSKEFRPSQGESQPRAEFQTRDTVQQAMSQLAGQTPDVTHAGSAVTAVPAASSREPAASSRENVTRGTERQSTWENRRLFENFEGILGRDTNFLSKPEPEELPIRDEEFVFGRLTPSIAQLLPETAARRDIQRKLLLGAGYHSRASWLNLTAIRFTLAFISLVIIGFWLNIAPPEFENVLLVLVVLTPLVMWALPPLIVAMKANERKIDIERGLPDLLDMMNMGISQGLTVPQSLGRISNEIAPAHPALAEELKIVHRQSQVGSLFQALRSFGRRIDSPDVNSFTTLLMQSDSTGTSISDSLTQYSDSIRSSLRERADSRANAASFKLLFPVALCLMPSVFLFLLGPAIVEMSDFFGTRAEALNTDRTTALESLRQQPRIDYTRFQQIENQ